VERKALIGQVYNSLLTGPHQELFESRFQTFLEKGFIEVESRWRKADGTVIDVWVKAIALKSPEGRVIRSRSVAQDITSRKRLESELREKNLRLAAANEELLRRNKEMDEFLHVVSHDLQEPLRTLDAFSDFLLTDYGDRLDEEGRNFVTYIVDASRRLRALIQDLAKLSRAGKVTNDFSPVNLNEVLDVVRADLAEHLRTRRAELQIEPALPELWGDRDRIRQLFTNLVSNGLKYNRGENPLVSVTLDRTRDEEGWATFAVRDNGIGIDPRDHHKIFQLFRRLHTQEEYEGTGAGLAICLKIVNAHGGAIEVQSELNQGAVFLVRLPTHPRTHS
jgi:light-regulated signal transduction histidine kinase (bacteriophytochrome)